MDISIITVNYNNSAITLDLVKSVQQYTPATINYEIIVVDNGSEYADYLNLTHILKSYQPTVTIIRSKINSGFGGGNMLGVQHATGKYFAFINNDVIFVEDCFSSLVKYITQNPKTGVITPQQYDRNRQPIPTFDHNHGIRRILFGKNFANLTAKVKRQKKHYQETLAVDFIQGAFMFFEAEKFAQVGGFDTNIFLYYEEMDICHRLRKNGYKSIVHPETQFIHVEGKNNDKNFLIKQELKISMFYVLKKNHNYGKYCIIRFFLLLRYLLKACINPKYRPLTKIIFTGKFLENSLKHQQKINLK